ncbi:MAG: Flp pilus assembly protein CpaB [Desulfotomaculaceae bacterium]|nr:Flp pilus assembly protein CpaB [Desulfotomaculaceae bacterium]
MKNKIILILAIVIGLIAAAGIYLFLDHTKKTYADSGDFIKVVVARQQIPAKTQISAQMIELKDVPAKYVHERAAVDAREAVGKITRSEILPGEQVLRDRLVKDKESGDGLALQIPPGKRAMTVAVNEVSGLAGLVRPGDRVDVLGTFDLQGAVGQEKSSITTLLIQNIDVLSIDQSTGPAGESSQDGKKTTTSARTITLSVTPEQAQPLALCSEKGTIRLALRPAIDQEFINLPSIRMNQLVH